MGSGLPVCVGNPARVRLLLSVLPSSEQLFANACEKVPSFQPYLSSGISASSLLLPVVAGIGRLSPLIQHEDRNRVRIWSVR
jgi:hypothetical protein